MSMCVCVSSQKRGKKMERGRGECGREAWKVDESESDWLEFRKWRKWPCLEREREGRVAGFITTYLLPAPLAPEVETRVAAEVARAPDMAIAPMTHLASACGLGGR